MSLGGLDIGEIGLGAAALGRAQAPVKAAPRQPTNGRTPAPHHVNFFALDGSADLTLLMGEGPATLSGGDPQWNEEARAGDSPVTWWQNESSYRQSIPILLDSPSDDWEQTIGILRSLKRSPGNRVPPPQVAIAGQAIHRADLTWVVEGVDEGVNVIRRASDGNRVRQDITVRLLQYGAVETVVERSPSKQAAGKGKQGTSGQRGGGTYIVKAGDTLPKIAARKDIYNDASKWKLIANANNIRDPRALKVGRKLTIPRA